MDSFILIIGLQVPLVLIGYKLNKIHDDLQELIKALKEKQK